ncbi:hypothetical protein GF358_04490 [Candidatus Woesearchaeota archaeon]|nr:hypothetical protein [Candidatus Woesearchaeota archaeon]
MKKIDFTQIKKLPPEEKIKVLERVEGELKTLIEKRKKEIEEKNLEIENAEELLQEAQNEAKVLEEIKTPEIKKVDIGKLFHPEEKDLEGIAATAPSEAEKKAQIEELSKQPVQELYNTVVGIKSEIDKTGIETLYQQEKIEQINEALYEKKKAVENKQYNPTKKARHLLTAAEQMMENYM